ncbi:MAG: hypothetical protein ACI9XC_001752 [Gammaproteobacteria bacterium]|jgi:hypothetical protein
MNMTLKSFLHIRAIYYGIPFIACLMIMQTTSAQTLAGKVVFAQGAPTAFNTDGTERGLSRASELFSGDRLVTDNGRLQISMLDGAFISVQPNSEYQIENYNYSGTPDGTEIANYRLVKGGVRAVTGLIGRQNPEAYKVNTAVATIGIRGTGHNTRICAGDCGTRLDGLYHQTWEGITFVVNDVDSQDVPTGMGVFVADIDTDIEVLDQPSAILAVETTRERQEDELEETEEQTRVVSSGEQRDETGDQVVISDSRGSSTVLTNFGILGVTADDPELSNVGVFSFGFGSSLFRRDSDNAVIAILGLEDDDEFDDFNTLATIDVAAVRGGDNAAEVSFAESFLSLANPALLSSLEESPASVAEFFFNEEIGFGRWADGRVLVLHNSDHAEDNEIIELAGNESIHFLFGTEPPSRPTTGEASYDFFGGTQSTTVSGDTIGEGVTEGHIDVDFGTSDATLDMNVNHDSIDYAVSGPLAIETDGGLLGTGSVFAEGGSCTLCPTSIDAGFAGPAEEGFPKYVALEYDIQTSDVIMGVAAFGFEAPPPPPPPPPPPLPTSTVLTNSVFLGVAPDDESLDGVDSFAGYAASLFLDGTELVGLLFTEEEGDFPPFTIFRTFATVDVDKVLGGDDAASVAEVQTRLAAADPVQVAIFDANTPATIADSFLDAGTGFGWGRWTNGFILSTDDGGLVDSTNAENFPGNQSVHLIFGQDPGVIATTGTAFYDFIGGTKSTSASGATLGNGVTSGSSIFVDFRDGSGSIIMRIDHIPGFPYLIFNQPLNVSPADNAIVDMSPGLQTTTAASGSACNPMCYTLMDGGFAGPSTSGIPGHIGIEYDIQDADVVMGVAGFSVGSFTATSTTLVQTNSGYIAISPEGITNGWDASIFLDANDNLIGALGTEDFDSPIGEFRVVNTIDLALMLIGDDSTSVTEVSSLVAGQSSGDQSIISAYSSGAASIQGSFYNATDGIGWGRWTSGSILSFDATPGTVESPLTGSQSAHFIFGKDEGIINTSGTATYNFFGGTTSTSAGGSTDGGGVTSGAIGINFTGTGTINMNVVHNTASYNVNGSLIVDPANGAVFDVTSGVFASTGAAGSACNPSCDAFIDGGFAGPNAGGVPKYIGIAYDIDETDPIMGVAGFSTP